MPPHPPKPRLAFRVGVVGHRWDKLAPGSLEHAVAREGELGAAVRGVLLAIREQLDTIGANPLNGYAEPTPQGPELLVVSGLAEGADRIVANQGLAAGCALWAVLPFGRARYAEDFDGRWMAPSWSRPGADADFDRLLGLASGSVVMDGQPGQFDAYEPLGRAVLNHSDVLIAIWDGATGRGAGGTAHLLMAARREEIPIVRVDPGAQIEVWLEDMRDPDHGREKRLSRLERRIADLVLPPEQAGLVPRTEWNGREAFFAERPVAGHLGTAYKALTGYLGSLHGPVAPILAPTFLAWFAAFGHLFQRRLPADFTATTRRAWEAQWATLDPALSTPLIDRLAPVHGWLDYLATYYADRYRSAFTMVFSLAWIAAVAAVIGFVAEVQEWGTSHIWAWVELLVIGGVVALTVGGKQRRLHERWIDYRLLAEQVRHLTFLWPLGVTGGNARLSANPWSDDPRVRWTGWYYRALVRELGFGATSYSPSHLAACRRLLRDLEIQAQRNYHDRNAARLEHLAQVIRRRTEWLFGAAAVTAALHVLHLSETFLYSATLTVLSVFFPSRAAALHGWAGHADFHAAALRSAEVELRLEEAERAIDGLVEVSTATLGPMALAAARAMEAELGSWRATSLSRPLERV